jgi:peroxiredoxin
MNLFNRLVFVAAAAISLTAASAATAAVEPGQPAPPFSLNDLNGKPVSLAQFKGKTVVMEWNNPNCPYVKKHYVSGNMPGLQKQPGAKDVVWLMVNSTNAKHAEYMDSDALKRWLAEHKAQPAAYLTDADGAVGKAYGAKTTPHMFIIDPAGKVVYNGAIDDKRGTNPDEIKSANNFVKVALADLAQGKQPAATMNQPYGCSVKY